MTKEYEQAKQILLAGAGSAAGWIPGALVGGPLGAAAGGLLSSALTSTLSDLSDRWLSERERARVGIAARTAVERIKARLEGSEAYTAYHAGASELLEATLRTTKEEPEERKVEYLGLLFANLVFDETSSTEAAHALIRIAEVLTYRQLCFLALIRLRGSVDVEGLRRNEHTNSELETLRREEMSLHSSDIGTIGLIGGGPWTDELNYLGSTLAGLMELERIPDEDMRVVEQLIESSGNVVG